MIEVSHVSRLFGNFRAVDDISFSIPTGEIVGLLGPNGAGKTTTMRMITGYLEPSAGTIKIDGKNITDDIVAAKSKIGYMPESAPLYPEMIVYDYLCYIAEMQGQPLEKVAKLAEECGLKEVMHKNIGDLSRGNRQRVGLAHALMSDPEILILDEPTGGLDPNQASDVRNLIKEIGKTRTVIISTHILSEVEMMCSRVIIISKGKKAADNSTSELKEQYGHKASVLLTAGACSEAELIASLQNIDCVSSISKCVGEQIESDKNAISIAINLNSDSKEIRPEIAKIILEKGWNLYELSMKKNSLEDIFHEITTEGSKK
ncbi:MAG: ABC transporter ATP-binding protein [Treponema sp.]|nr:ABC transporter ATP-binding protein [Treponema sp.]